MKRIIGLGVRSMTALGLCLLFRCTASDRPNVLFIAADDLRMNLGCYGDEIAVTPNIDKLAEKSLVFTRAYCQFASCNASRASVLTGKRPDSISVWKLNTHYRDTAPDVVTLPQHFKENGYHTESIGKVLHNYSDKIRDNDLSWSVPARFDKVNHFRDYALEANIPEEGKLVKTIAAEKADVSGDAYADDLIVRDAEETMARLASQSKPFFLAVGFLKPHSPFNAPQEYWDLYDRKEMEALCEESRPEGMSALNWHESRELRGFVDTKAEGPFSVETQARMRHGYYAATSYLDANVGRLMKALDGSGLADNTIVVFWSDHGYHLGENGQWTKATVRELDAQVPLLVSTPGGSRGVTDALVEYVDLYPSLSALCALPEPEPMDGRSFAKVLENPRSPFRKAALTQVCRPWVTNKPIEQMGYSIRAGEFRYTQWVDHEDQTILAEELYDLSEDPYQRRNLVESSSPEVVSHYRFLLKDER